MFFMENVFEVLASSTVKYSFTKLGFPKIMLYSYKLVVNRASSVV